MEEFGVGSSFSSLEVSIFVTRMNTRKSNQNLKLEESLHVDISPESSTATSSYHVGTHETVCALTNKNNPRVWDGV